MGERPVYWNNGFYVQAVLQAALRINAETQAKLGLVQPGEVKLFQMAFSLDDPKPDAPRLRLMHGSGYERIATQKCSDRTIRRRLKHWATTGVAQRIHAIILTAYDQIIGLELGEVSVDGCITKAPCGGEKAGPSPVDRRKGGLKRSVATEGHGVPVGVVSAGANRHDSPLLAPTLDATTTQLGRLPADRTAHLDAGYDSQVTRDLLTSLGFSGEISRKGVPAPVQVGQRWVVERTHSWMNGYGKLRRCTDKNGAIVDFYLYLAAAIVTVRQLIQRARNRYRWASRPTVRRLK